MLRLFSGSAVIRLSGAFAQLLLTLVISRVCGPTEAGIYFFGYSVLVIVATLIRFGSELSALRVVAHLFDEGDADAVRVAVGTRLAVVMVGGTAAGALIAASGPFVADLTYGSDVAGVMLAAGATVPALAAVALCSEVLKGANRAWLALTFQNLATPVLAMPAILLLTGAGHDDAVTVSTVVLVASWVVAAGAVLTWLATFRRRFGAVATLPTVSRSEIRSIMRDAPDLLTVSLTSIVMQWMGAVLLGFLAPAADVAGYSVAVRISIAVSVVHSAASSVAGPRMSIAYAAGRIDDLRRVCHQTGVLIAAITWPVLVAMFVLAGPCLDVFGDGYDDYALLLRILVAAQLVAALIGHSGMVLVMCGHYAMARFDSLFAAGLIVLLSVLFVPALQAEGAVIAMAGAVVGGHTLALFLVRREIGIWTIPVTGAEWASVLRRGRPASQAPDEGVVSR